MKYTAIAILLVSACTTSGTAVYVEPNEPDLSQAGSAAEDSGRLRLLDSHDSGAALSADEDSGTEADAGLAALEDAAVDAAASEDAQVGDAEVDANADAAALLGESCEPCSDSSDCAEGFMCWSIRNYEDDFVCLYDVNHLSTVPQGTEAQQTCRAVSAGLIPSWGAYGTMYLCIPNAGVPCNTWLLTRDQ